MPISSLRAAACAALLALAAMPLAAQRAYYPGLQTVVDTGLSAPQSVAVDTSLNVYIADTGNNRVLIEPPLLPPATAPYTRATVIPMPSIGGNRASPPWSIAVDSSSGYLFAIVATGSIGPNGLSDLSPVLLKLAPPNYQPVPVNFQAHPALNNNGLFFGLATDSQGHLDLANNLAQVYEYPLTPSGDLAAPCLAAATWSPNLLSLAVDPNENLYVGVPGDNVYKLSPGCSSAASYPALLPGMASQQHFGIAADSHGNVFATNTSIGPLVEMPSSGPTQFGWPIQLGYGLSGPLGLAADFQGNVYVADTGNNRVVKIDPGPVDFGTWTVNTVSSPAIPIAFVFTAEGEVGRTFVNTTGSVSGTPPGEEFIDTGTGSCKAHRRYIAGATCTIVATCDPKRVDQFVGSAGLVDDNGHAFVAAALTCKGAPLPPQEGGLTYICALSNYCGAFPGGTGAPGLGSPTAPFGNQDGGLHNSPLGGERSFVPNTIGGSMCGPGHAPSPTVVCIPEVLNLYGPTFGTDLIRLEKRQDEPIVRFKGESTILLTSEPKSIHEPEAAAQRLRIDSVEVSEIAPTSARVSWKTNLPSRSGVLYAVNRGPRLPTLNTPDATTKPALELKGLKPGEEYHLTLWSATDNEVASSTLTFTTPKK